MILLLTVLIFIFVFFFALEASKVVMQYVAAVSGKGWEVDRVKEQLLQSNPVLEGEWNDKFNLHVLMECVCMYTKTTWLLTSW